MLIGSAVRPIIQRLFLITTVAFVAAACNTPSTSPAVTVTVTPGHAATSTPTAAYPSVTSVNVAAPTQTGPKSVIDQDGTYLVGVDIQPGMYRTSGGSQCYWARLSSLDTSDIIDNHNSSGPQVIEILPTDRAFLSQNCQMWTAESTLGPAVRQRAAAIPTQVASPPASIGTGLLACNFTVALAIRTQLSEVVVCEEASGGYTYKGLRLKDLARIDIPGAVPNETGFTVINGGTRYEVSGGGLHIYTDGEVFTEPAVEGIR